MIIAKTLSRSLRIAIYFTLFSSLLKFIVYGKITELTFFALLIALVFLGSFVGSMIIYIVNGDEECW